MLLTNDREENDKLSQQRSPDLSGQALTATTDCFAAAAAAAAAQLLLWRLLRQPLRMRTPRVRQRCIII